MKRYYIYEKRFMSLNGEDDEMQYHAIPEEHIKTGAVRPGNLPGIKPDPISEVEARNVDEAILNYREKRANAVW